MSHRFTGTCLFLGGLCYVIANSLITPLMPQPEDWTQSFATPEFVARLSVAAASVFFLLIGAFGIRARQARKTGRFGTLAFAILFTGSLFAFAHEWAQVFFLHPLAVTAPEGLRAIGDAAFPSLYLVEVMIALSLFMAGWILMMVSTLIARIFNPIAPLMVLGGMLAVPVLASALPGIWGFVLGNTIIGLGWMMMGLELRRAAPPQA